MQFLCSPPLQLSATSSLTRRRGFDGAPRLAFTQYPASPRPHAANDEAALALNYLSTSKTPTTSIRRPPGPTGPPHRVCLTRDLPEQAQGCLQHGRLQHAGRCWRHASSTFGACRSQLTRAAIGTWLRDLGFAVTMTTLPLACGYIAARATGAMFAAANCWRIVDVSDAAAREWVDRGNEVLKKPGAAAHICL